jgi:hypothetical protein
MPLIAHFGFACPIIGRNWRRMLIGKQARPCTCEIQPNARVRRRTFIAWDLQTPTFAAEGSLPSLDDRRAIRHSELMVHSLA